MKSNTYYDNLFRKVLTETLEGKADEIMEKLKFNPPGKSFDYVQEGETCEQCGSEMTEGECMECGMREGEMLETRYVTSKGHKFSDEKKPLSRQDMEIGMNNMPGFDMEEYCAQYYDMDPERCQSYYDQKEYNDNRGEIDERLHGKQSRLDKNKNGRIDSEDFRLLRKKGKNTEMEEGNAFSGALANAKKEGKSHFSVDGKKYPVKESKRQNDNGVLYKLEYINETALFTEDEIIDIIEGIIKEESKTKNTIKTGKTPAGYMAYEKSHKGSGKEEDDYMKSFQKKMKDYLKDGSKGKYEMNPKHFPMGNGEIEKMEKMAYVPSNAVQDYVDNFTAAALENLDFNDGIAPNEDWMTDNIEGSSRTGNNPEWANAVETPTNKKRNKIRKDNLLGKLKRKAYNKSAQPIVSDKTGNETDKASKVMMKLESTEEKQTKKLNEEFDRMKSLIGYQDKTQ